MSNTSRQSVLRPQDINFTAEAQSIQDSAASGIVRVVILGPLVFFSAASGDAWVLDPDKGVAAALARGGDLYPIPMTESATEMTIHWSTDYRIEDEIFLAIDRDGGAMRKIAGYPTALIASQLKEHAAALARLRL